MAIYSTRAKEQEKIAYSSSLTGSDDKSKQLYYQLKRSIAEADGIDLVVSFLMESGIRLLLTDLQKALARNVKIRILTGNYLGITQPSALYLIKYELDDKVDLRFYNDSTRSFHPKAYIFHYSQKGYSEIFVGSSNISRSALTTGIEWNYRLRSSDDALNYNAFFAAFEDLYNNHSLRIDDDILKEYSKKWHHPEAMNYVIKHDNLQVNEPAAMYRPRGAQIEALYALKKSRDEGATRALVQAATGIGKTYLAVFDSLAYERILFVAHREEILLQAARSFGNVRPNDDYGFFYGKRKDLAKTCLFASVETLGQTKYLNEHYYGNDNFDYIIIDEFHHAVTQNYQNILNYFKPKFILGLTATPERMDRRSIYEICDYNVPYEISLYEAINKGFLVPFHYYGIYDEVDYTDVTLVNGHFSIDELNGKFLQNKKRCDTILKHYRKYHSQRALGFCTSREHAELMAAYFSDNHISAAAVYSDAASQYAQSRKEAIRNLEAGKIRVIFAVDMFNEGVDIPSLDMVMFLRPTESPIIFLQQLGRGLRIYKNKRFLNVLDFIGNYEKAGRFIGYLTDCDKEITRYQNPIDIEDFPDGCLVDFDIRLIDVFEKIAKRKITHQKLINNEFYRIKHLLGHVPSRLELFTEMDSAIYDYCLNNSKANIFKHYLDYLAELGELNKCEQSLYKTIAREFLHEIETANLTKIYKIPVLYAFYNHGNILMEVHENDVLTAWKEFFNHETNWKDLKKGITYIEYCAITDKQHLTHIKKMPIKYLKSLFFVEKAGSLLALNGELNSVIDLPVFKQHFSDILKYRTMDYYKRRYQMKH